MSGVYKVVERGKEAGEILAGEWGCCDTMNYTPCCVDTIVHLALNKTLVALSGL